jgi:hypothetical protein
MAGGAIGARQRIFVGERVGERGDWLFEQMEDYSVGGVPKRLRQPLYFVPDPVGKASARRPGLGKRC